MWTCSIDPVLFATSSIPGSASVVIVPCSIRIRVTSAVMFSMPATAAAPVISIQKSLMWTRSEPLIMWIADCVPLHEA